MASIKTIRSALIAKFGERQYRITRSGEIHVFGTMPNTNSIGWYLYGYTDDTDDTETNLHLKD
jgi:hypothetical protein